MGFVKSSTVTGSANSSDYFPDFLVRLQLDAVLNLILETKLTADEKQDLVAFLRQL